MRTSLIVARGFQLVVVVQEDAGGMSRCRGSYRCVQRGERDAYDTVGSVCVKSHKGNHGGEARSAARRGAERLDAARGRVRDALLGARHLEARELRVPRARGPDVHRECAERRRALDCGDDGPERGVLVDREREVLERGGQLVLRVRGGPEVLELQRAEARAARKRRRALEGRAGRERERLERAAVFDEQVFEQLRCRRCLEL